MLDQGPGSGAASVSKLSSNLDRPGGSAGSEHRRGGVSLAKEGDEAVPAPTACVGDVRGATSCARRIETQNVVDRKSLEAPDLDGNRCAGNSLAGLDDAPLGPTGPLLDVEEKVHHIAILTR